MGFSTGVSFESRSKVIEEKYGMSLSEVLILLNNKNFLVSSEITKEFNKIFRDNNIPEQTSNKFVEQAFKRLEVHRLSTKDNPRIKEIKSKATKKYTEANKEKIRQNTRRQHQDPAFKEKIRDNMTLLNQNPEFNAKKVWSKERCDRQREYMYNNWKQEEYRNKMLNSLMYHWNDENRTKPEKIVKEILDKLNVCYTEQKYLSFKGGIRVRPDFYISRDKVIEVQGDFFHVNPSKYDLQSLTKTQEKTINRDQIKHCAYINNGINVLYLWENDIDHRREEVISRIVEFVFILK